MSSKQARLREDVSLQPHQQRLEDEARTSPLRKLLYYQLGSGKSLASIAANEARDQPYTVVVPAALRENYKGELRKFTDGSLPVHVMSYTALARGTAPEHPGSLVFDEAHRLRNPHSAATRQAVDLASNADQVLLLSGTPLTNRPGDLAPLLSMLTNQQTSPDEFEERFTRKETITPSLWQRLFHGATKGEHVRPANLEELRSLLAGKIDYYAPDRQNVSVAHEDVEVETSPEQTKLYQAMWKKLPAVTRWKLQKDFPLSSEELLRLRNFLSGPRQVSLSTYPYLRIKDPLKAFSQSTKLQEASRRLEDALTDPRAKALVFSNFIEAGLTPYAADLARKGVPHAVFHGGLTDAERRKLVADYDAGRLRVALIGPSGMEGLSFKGTSLIQQLDPHFHGVRPRQAEGRAVRFDSHDDLPPELRNVRVERFVSRLPAGLVERLKARLLGRSPRLTPATDDHLLALSRRKDELNERFLDELRRIGSAGRSAT